MSHPLQSNESRTVDKKSFLTVADELKRSAICRYDDIVTLSPMARDTLFRLMGCSTPPTAEQRRILNNSFIDLNGRRPGEAGYNLSLSYSPIVEKAISMAIRESNPESSSLGEELSAIQKRIAVSYGIRL